MSSPHAGVPEQKNPRLCRMVMLPADGHARRARHLGPRRFRVSVFDVAFETNHRLTSWPIVGRLQAPFTPTEFGVPGLPLSRQSLMRRRPGSAVLAS